MMIGDHVLHEGRPHHITEFVVAVIAVIPMTANCAAGSSNLLPTSRPRRSCGGSN